MLISCVVLWYDVTSNVVVLYDITSLRAVANLSSCGVTAVEGSSHMAVNRKFVQFVLTSPVSKQLQVRYSHSYK